MTIAERIARMPESDALLECHLDAVSIDGEGEAETTYHFADGSSLRVSGDDAVVIEGVPYSLYQITFRLHTHTDPVQWYRWAPNEYFLREQLVREFDARGMAPEDFVPGSLVVE